MSANSLFSAQFSNPALALSTSSLRRRLCLVFALAVSLVTLITMTILEERWTARTGMRALEIWQGGLEGLYGSGTTLNEGPGCDPTATEGYVRPSRYWHSLSTGCPSSDISTLIQTTPRADLWSTFPSLRNKSVLLMGDSVARHLTEDMCGALGGKDRSRHAEGWRPSYSEAVICEVEELGLRLVNFHIYGFANATDPETAAILSKGWPGDTYAFEDRLPRLFNEIVPGFIPDYIQVSGMAWDFLYLYTKDVLGKERHDDIPALELATFGSRLLELFDYLGTSFPSAKLTYMHAARVLPDDYAQKKTWGNKHLGLGEGESLKEGEYPPLFSIRRQAQYMANMREVTSKAGIDSVDYAKIHHAMSDEEFYTPQENVHPWFNPRRVMVGMILQKLQRFAEYGL